MSSEMLDDQIGDKSGMAMNCAVCERRFLNRSQFPRYGLLPAKRQYRVAEWDNPGGFDLR